MKTIKLIIIAFLGIAITACKKQNPEQENANESQFEKTRKVFDNSKWLLSEAKVIEKTEDYFVERKLEDLPQITLKIDDIANSESNATFTVGEKQLKGDVSLSIGYDFNAGENGAVQLFYKFRANDFSQPDIPLITFNVNGTPLTSAKNGDTFFTTNNTSSDGRIIKCLYKKIN